jgi:hypothetical protein
MTADGAVPPDKERDWFRRTNTSENSKARSRSSPGFAA